MPTQLLRLGSAASIGRRLAPGFAALATIVALIAAVNADVSAAQQKPAETQPAQQAPPTPVAAPGAPAAKAVPADGNEAHIRAGAQAFIKAFNAGDAKALAEMWTPNGTIADEQGNVFKGRKAIEEQYAALFKAHPGVRMQIAIKSIDFPSSTTAIEDGVTQLLTKDSEPPSAARYTAVQVQEDGKWLMASVREAAMPVASNFAQLQELGWLVGEWEAKSDGVTAHSQIRWIANKSFLQRTFSVNRDGMQVASGMQIIGWEPRSERIVSWTFDSSGGHGMGIWNAMPEGWGIDSTGVTADGVPTTAKDHLIRVPGESNVFGWRSVDRKLGDTKVPDVPEVVFDRVTSK
jgi:uncharacterized protein (TIGR02246 family)